MADPTFHETQGVFAQAIQSGRMSKDPNSPIYAGHYMYMGTIPIGDTLPVREIRHTFKHRDTRHYLA